MRVITVNNQMNTNFVPKKGIASQHGGDDHCNDAFSFLPFRKENGANSEAAKRKNKTSGALRNTHTHAVAEKEKTDRRTDDRRLEKDIVKPLTA